MSLSEPSPSKPLDQAIELTLNSFVRRTQQTNKLKGIIKSYDATLSRKGRSRNWILSIPVRHKKDLITKLYEANESSWLWVAKLLSEQSSTYNLEQLLSIAQQTPAITVTELIHLTDCTLAEARKVLDELEWIEQD